MMRGCDSHDVDGACELAQRESVPAPNPSRTESVIGVRTTYSQRATALVLEIGFYFLARLHGKAVVRTHRQHLKPEFYVLTFRFIPFACGRVGCGCVGQASQAGEPDRSVRSSYIERILFLISARVAVGRDACRARDATSVRRERATSPKSENVATRRPPRGRHRCALDAHHDSPRPSPGRRHGSASCRLNLTSPRLTWPHHAAPTTHGRPHSLNQSLGAARCIFLHGSGPRWLLARMHHRH